MSLEPGKKVDVGGFKLNYIHTERNNHQPTIVLESGYGMPASTWRDVQTKVSEFSSSLSYDRAALGASDRGEKPMHSRQIVRNLHVLLNHTHIEPPYILVGHSFGGLNVRLFANTYPDEVAGLVLIDPSHEDQEDQWMPLLPEKFQKAFKGQFKSEGTYDEFLESMDQVRAARNSFGDIPLIILSAGRKDFHTDDSYTTWINLHKDLLNLSSNHSHTIVENSGHHIHREQPEVVIDTIRKMIQMTRQG